MDQRALDRGLPGRRVDLGPQKVGDVEHVAGALAKGRDMRGGRDYDSQWGTRMKGTGPMAWMIGRRFEIACEKLGLNKRRSKLTSDHFARPKRSGQQLSLF